MSEQPLSFDGDEIATSASRGQALRPPRNDKVHKIKFDRTLQFRLNGEIDGEFPASTANCRGMDVKDRQGCRFW